MKAPQTLAGGVRVVAINGLIVLVSTLFALSIGILSVEFFHLKHSEDHRTPMAQFDAELGWSAIPNWHGPLLSWGQVSTNSLGFRSPEIDPAKKQIVILGDSVALGFGVNDDETASHYLEEKLAPLGYQVSNLGVSCYGIDQDYLYFKRHVNKFRRLTKVILMIYTANDLLDTKSNVSCGKRKPLFTLKNGHLKLTNTPLLKRYCLRNLFSKSYFIERISSWDPKIENFFNFIAGDRAIDMDEAKQVLALLIKKIEELARSRGAEFIVIVSPDLEDLFRKSDVLSWFQDLMKQDGYTYLDYFEVLKRRAKNSDDLYVDRTHYSPLGNQLLAETIFSFLNLPREKTKQ